MYKNPMQFAWKVLEMMYDAENEELSRGLSWYKSLTLNQRINIKDAFVLVCGIDFQKINFLFNFKERINLLYLKLIEEKIIQEVM